jgi:hypothetical protein
MPSKKAAKWLWYLKLVPLFMPTSYLISAFSFEKVAPKEKALQKENGRFFCAHAARATAFKKAEQNNRLVSVNNVPYKLIPLKPPFFRQQRWFVRAYSQ